MDTPPPNPIRVGMIAMTDLDDPNPVSGMPHRTACALREQGIEIIPIPARKHAQGERPALQQAMDRAAWIHRKRTPMWVKRTIDNLLPFLTRSVEIRRARAFSRRAQRNLESRLANGERIDALFGCCVSAALYALETDLPIVYFSDATSPILVRTYPIFAERGAAYHRVLREIETAALQRASVSLFAAPATLKSAIEDLSADTDRSRVVAMGAHVYPDDPGTVIAPASAPSRESCDLLIVAAKPVRKRVDLATEAAEILRSRGIGATLHVVGRGTVKSNASEAVDSVGPLKLSDPTDRVRHQELLRDCHLQLLPSLGEAFGIAPTESAHFGRPSIVADAGGLPFVVLDGQTGVVMAVDADGSAWADAIESLIEDPERYRAMSSGALERACGELNWEAWGAGVRSILAEQIRLR